MRRVLAVMVALLLAVSVLVGGCAAEKEAEIQPCAVEIVAVSSLFSGMESVSKSVTYIISNPNDYEVTISLLEYMLTADERGVGATQFPHNMYIPAGKDIELTGYFVTGLNDIITGFFLGEAMPIQQAAVASLPIWKTYGGKLPSPFAAMQAMWDDMPSGPPVYKAEGMLTMRSPEGQTLEVSFTTSWQAD